MVGLLDVAPSVRTLKTSLGEIEVPGISMIGIVSILKDHPELIAVLQGEGDVELATIMDLGADVTASFFAAGLGYPGDVKAKEMVKTRLKPEDTLEIGIAIWEETFPKGVKGFLERLNQAMKLAGLKVELDLNSLSNLQKPVKD